MASVSGRERGIYLYLAIVARIDLKSVFYFDYFAAGRRNRASKDRNSFPVAKVDTRREAGAPGVFGIPRFRGTRSTLSTQYTGASYRPHTCGCTCQCIAVLHCSASSVLDHTRYRVNHPALPRIRAARPR